MIKKLLLISLFSVEIFAQTDTLQQSFFDEIDLLFGVEAGGISSFTTNKLLEARKQDGTAFKKNIKLSIQPMINLKVGLRGFGFLFKVNLRGNFITNGAVGYQENINGEEIFNLTESFSNYGIELTYDVTDFFTCGLHYDKHYNYSNRGEGIVENPTLVILPGGYSFYRQPEFNTNTTFSQIQLVAKYNYSIKDLKLFSKLNFTLYSTAKNNYAIVLLNDIENFGTATNIGNTTYYKKNPFNLQLELGAKLNFPLYPFFRFEFLSFDGLYRVYMYSLNLRFQIPE